MGRGETAAVGDRRAHPAPSPAKLSAKPEFGPRAPLEKLLTRIDGKTYDISGFLDSHPGGSDLVMLAAGRDATTLFYSYHRRMDVARKFLDSLPQVDSKELDVELPVHATALGTERDEEGRTLPTALLEDDGFYAEVKRRVNVYFEETGQQSRGGVLMVLKSLVTLSLLAGAWYSTLVLGMWYTAPVLGVIMAVCGLSIQHDANHGALSTSPTINWVFGLVDDLIGGSSLAWRHQHMVAHHADPNDAELDCDTYHQWPLIRFNPALPAKPFQKHQHVYGPMLYSFMGMAYGFGDIGTVLAGAYGHVQLHKMRPVDLAVFWGGKAVYYTLFYAVPVALYGWAYGLLALVLPTQLVGGFFLASTFAVSHNSTGAAYNVPRTATDFGELQTRTAVNWSVWGDCPDWMALFWLLVSGGLNYQIEHHLFPGVAHLHYPAISRIVRAVCEERGVPYNAYSTFGDIYAEHIQTLKLLGAGDRDDEVLAAAPRCLESCMAVEGDSWKPLPGERRPSRSKGKEAEKEDEDEEEEEIDGDRDVEEGEVEEVLPVRRRRRE